MESQLLKRESFSRGWRVLGIGEAGAGSEGAASRVEFGWCCCLGSRVRKTLGEKVPPGASNGDELVRGQLVTRRDIWQLVKLLRLLGFIWREEEGLGSLGGGLRREVSNAVDEAGSREQDWYRPPKLHRRAKPNVTHHEQSSS